MSESESEFWICRGCAGTYNVPLDMQNHSKIGTGRWHLIARMGICPMCGEVRNLHKTEKMDRPVLTETQPKGPEGASPTPTG
jgi:hypothetical protein